MSWSLLGLVGGGFLATAVGVAMFARWATHARLIDVPNARSSHDSPTPRGSGVVIVIVVMVGLWALGWTEGEGRGVALAALVIAAVSAIDDLRSLPIAIRLLVHLACASFAVVSIASGGDAEPLLPTAMCVGALWVVGLTNAYNFMDGIDGISGAQAMVTGTAVAAAGAYAGLDGAIVAGAAIAGSAAGFLVHNWSPARVFMGDVGSAFLGFMFAVLALQIGRHAAPLGLAVALSLWLYLFDTSVTLLRRALAGENVLRSHRSHLYQRLVIAGWSHGRVALLYAVAAALGGIVGFLWAAVHVRASVLALIPLIAAVIWATVAREEASSRTARGAGHGEAPIEQ